MRIFVALLGVLLAVTAEAAQAETLPPCQEAYQTGVEQFNRGEYQDASNSLVRAIKLAPGPEAEPTEYLPYIYYSVTQFKLGHNREARDALIQSQVFGVAPKTETGVKLLDQYAAKIMSAPLSAPSFVAEPQSSPVDYQSFSLSDQEVELIRSQVLRRCSLSEKIADNKLPWYFHYEFGVDLMKAGDAQRAVDAFTLGANVREDPRRGKRMYGMWYIDYLPYYQIALAHSKLGNWESANNAIRASESFGEFAPSDPGYENFSALDNLIKSNLEHSDS
jgi:tetratricopeptide (TPR) repeat protein